MNVTRTNANVACYLAASLFLLPLNARTLSSVCFLPQNGADSAGYDFNFVVGPYEARFRGYTKPRNCPSAYESFRRLVRSAGLPKVKGDSEFGLDNVQYAARARLVQSYRNLEACECVGSFSYDYDPSIESTFTAWLLSGRDLLVYLPADSKGMAENLAHSPVTLPADERRSTAARGSYPHSDVISPDRLTIGTLLAEDPPAKYENGTPAYDVSAEGPKFVRQFKPLFAGSLPDKANFNLDIVADPPKKVRFTNNSTRTIVRKGDMQIVEWDIYPALDGHWFNDDEADITLSGTISQFDDPTDKSPRRTVGVDIPNHHFKIVRRSVEGTVLDGAKTFFTSLPGWVSLIEAAALAVVGFLRRDWLKPQVSAIDASANARAPE